jgi:hypothetical protein
VNERRARRIVYARSGGWCEVCGGRGATQWHHRKNRSQGGKWTAANGLHLCAPCHTHITHHPIAARDNGWSVLSGHDPAASRVRLAHRPGWCLLSDAGDVTETDRLTDW